MADVYAKFLKDLAVDPALKGEFRDTIRDALGPAELWKAGEVIVMTQGVFNKINLAFPGTLEQVQDIDQTDLA